MWSLEKKKKKKKETRKKETPKEEGLDNFYISNIKHRKSPLKKQT